MAIKVTKFKKIIVDRVNDEKPRKKSHKKKAQKKKSHKKNMLLKKKQLNMFKKLAKSSGKKLNLKNGRWISI